MESVQDQYITRHLPDGRIIYADHRIATIAGYLPGEVLTFSMMTLVMNPTILVSTIASWYTLLLFWFTHAMTRTIFNYLLSARS